MSGVEQQRLLAAALNRLKKLEKVKAFDAADASSRPTQSQQEVIKAFTEEDLSVIAVLGGNQCLAKGTLVATPAGPIPIEAIKVGDTVYDENGQPIKVLNTFQNGLKKVRKLTNRGKEYGKATDSHVFLVEDGHGREHEREVAEFKRDDKVKRVRVKSPLGKETYPQAYAFGAMLGDGCCREKRLTISGQDEEIVRKCAEVLNCDYSKAAGNNYNWKLTSDDFPLYSTIRGKYAHEKTIDAAFIRSLDRKSLLNLVAGIVDTDGSLHGSADMVRLSICMQAKSVIDAVKYAFLALWQVELSEFVDARNKYVNGPVFEVYTASYHEVRHILEELSPYLQCERKRWSSAWENRGGKRSRLDTLKLKGSDETVEVETYDIHVDSPRNLYCLANGLVTHNSGKSQLSMRLLGWLLDETGPEGKLIRKEHWGEGPIQILLLSQTLKQAEDSLWRKLEPLLTDKYKVQRTGGAISKVQNLSNGNSLLFFSHNNINEARKNIQSFTAHVAVIDELPSKFKLIEEVLRRLQANKGVLLLPFTPKVPNPEIKKFVDSLKAPFGRMFKLKALDNPVYDEDAKRRILESTMTMSEAMKRTVLEGDWMQAEDAVFNYDEETFIEDPPNYHPSWAHVEASDPALSSKFGIVVAAHCPTNNVWYIIRDEYIEGVPLDRIVDTVLDKTQGINIVRRVMDPHETWYQQLASSRGLNYMYPYDKSGRKGELITNLQKALGSKVKIASWCRNLPEELASASWSPSHEGRIHNSSAYHLIDCSQYLVDCLPKTPPPQQNLTWQAELRKANEERKKREKTARQARANRKPGRVRRRRRFG